MAKNKNKKKKKSKAVNLFLLDNRVILAALGGVAAGISLASILGTEKAKQIVQTVEESVKGFSQKIQSGLSSSKDEVKPHNKVKSYDHA